MKIKKISLIIAIAMCIFSGIFGLVEAAVQDDEMFNEIKIESRINIDVELKIISDFIDGFGESGSKLNFSINAGEIKVISQQGKFPSFHFFSFMKPMEVNSKLFFSCEYEEAGDEWRGIGSRNGVFHVIDEDYDWGPVGRVEVVIKVINQTLYITIDSINGRMMFHEIL